MWGNERRTNVHWSLFIVLHFIIMLMNRNLVLKKDPTSMETKEM